MEGCAGDGEEAGDWLMTTEGLGVLKAPVDDR